MRRLPIVLSLFWVLDVTKCWAAAEVDFHIHEGYAPHAIHEYMDQSGWRVLYLVRQLRNVRTHAVEHRADPEAAFVEMFGGTGFGCKFMSRDQLIVKPLAPGRSLRHCERKTPDALRTATTFEGNDEDLQEVVITGTHLHAAADDDEVGSSLLQLKADSPLWFGATTVPEILRRLPQDFRGGPSEDTHGVGAETGSNSGLGVAANLRGLGARATLTLINGRRVAPSGDDASFTDLLNIPLSAVERIDVLMDGASAVYGADAVGGVVNIITRKSFSGAQIFADIGSGTDGTQKQFRVGQLLGHEWDSGGFIVALEDYGRDALASERRASATSDLLPWGPDLGTPYSNPGTLTTRTETFAVPSGRHSAPLDLSTLAAGSQNLSDSYADSDILPRQRRLSVYASLHQFITDRIEAFGTVLWSERQASEEQGGDRVSIRIPSPLPGVEPFLTNVPADAGPIRLEYDLGDALGTQISRVKVRTVNLSSGLEIDLPRGWHAATSIADVLEQESQHTLNGANTAALQSALATSTTQTQFNPLDGSTMPAAVIAAIREVPWFGMHSELWQFHASADGPLFHLPGGDVLAAIGIEHRNQFFRTGLSGGATSPVTGSDLGRRLYATFAELNVPLVGADNAYPGLRKLVLSMASRYEDYSDFGSTLTPRFWTAYSPVESVEIRGSYARSTRAPNLGDLDERQNVSFLKTLADNSAAAGAAQVLVWSGKNAGLSAERATSYTLGLHFTPASVPALRADIDYFNTVFRDRIQTTGVDSDSGIVPELLNDPQYQAIVNRNPSATQRQLICQTTRFAGVAPDCKNAAITAIVDLRTLNIATLATRGIDFSASFSSALAFGQLEYGLLGAYLLDYSQRSTPNAPVERLLNTPNNPLNLQFVAHVGWRCSGLYAQLTTNYSNGYRDPAAPAKPNVPSWTTFDAGMYYELKDSQNALLNNLTVGFNVKNIFDKGPPTLVNQADHVAYDQENADLTGRIIRMTLSKRW